jgi:hypothetical protein
VLLAIMGFHRRFHVLDSAGRTVEGNSSLFGVGLFIVWLLLVALCLWQAAGTAAPESEAERQQ